MRKRIDTLAGHQTPAPLQNRCLSLEAEDAGFPVEATSGAQKRLKTLTTDGNESDRKRDLGNGPEKYILGEEHRGEVAEAIVATGELGVIGPDGIGGILPHLYITGPPRFHLRKRAQSLRRRPCRGVKDK